MKLVILLVACFVINSTNDFVRDFSAKQLDKTIMLEWDLEDATKTAYVKVERSVDNEQFEVIGRVASEESKLKYEYIDKSPLEGESYYRLHIFTKEGKGAYSESLLLELGSENTVGIPTGAKWRDSDYYYK